MRKARGKSGRRPKKPGRPFTFLRYYFLASARFVSKKNLSHLLLAYERYKALRGKRSWKLVVIGDGPLRKNLHRQCRDLKLDDDVSFPGFVQYSKLPAYYGLAGAFVHVSVVEQWGLVVNEALAAGLPVLVLDRCGCVRELVSEGRNGFVFDALDIERLVELMARLSDNQIPARWGRSANKLLVTGRLTDLRRICSALANTALAVGHPHPGLVNSFLLRTLPYL